MKIGLFLPTITKYEYVKKNPSSSDSNSLTFKKSGYCRKIEIQSYKNWTKMTLSDLEVFCMRNKTKDLQYKLLEKTLSIVMLNRLKKLFGTLKSLKEPKVTLSLVRT